MSNTWRDFRGARALFLAILFLSLAPAARAADWTLVEEHWYIMEIAGARAGWVHAAVHEKDDEYRTSSQTRMTMGRGLDAVTIEMESTFIETKDGRPRLMRTRQVMSEDPVVTEWEFHEDKALMRSGDMSREHPLPEGVWLTPYAAQRFVRERLAADASEITYRTIDGQAGLTPITMRRVRTGEGEFEAGGRTVPVTIWRATSDIIPVPTTEHYSSDGHAVFSEVSFGQTKIVTRLAPGGRAEAMEEVEGEVPEMMLQTFVKPDRPIEDVLTTRTATLRVRTTAESGLPELPSTGAQRVELAEDRHSAMIHIDVNNPLPASGEDAANTEYLEQSPLLDFEDERVRGLARRALQRLGEDAGPREQVEAMRRLVFRHINRKGMDTGFASASETARTRTGDCSEHAVLLAAMLRAEGIPSRVATGLVYVDEFAGVEGIFGWHMWAQALVEDTWIDLDATMPGPYNAGHLLIGVSSLADGLTSSDMASLVVLMGNLEIEIIEVGR